MRIVIVDDHNLFREGLAAIIREEPDIEVVGLVGTVQEAVDTVCALKPDIVLMDFSLPDGTGAEATRKIIQDYPDCKVVFMTMSDNDEDLLTAIRSGAVGYLLKNMNPSKLVAALRSVQQGESALSRSMTLRVMQELSRIKEPEPAGDPTFGKLTPREEDVLAELAAGKSNQEIACELCISENTVKYHVHSILEKLSLRDRKEAGIFAREHGVKASG
jgi:two-component system, NarL family, nitrate/nitrite response regulator NarL